MRRWLVALSLAAVASQLLQVAGEEADEVLASCSNVQGKTYSAAQRTSLLILCT